ncbi:hypothetical protein D3C72_1045200 [compost metagenome]
MDDPWRRVKGLPRAEPDREFAQRGDPVRRPRLHLAVPAGLYPRRLLHGRQPGPGPGDQHQPRDRRQLRQRSGRRRPDLLPYRLQEQDRIRSAGLLQRLLVDAHEQRAARAHQRHGRQPQLPLRRSLALAYFGDLDEGSQEPDHRPQPDRHPGVLGLFVVGLDAEHGVLQQPVGAVHRQADRRGQYLPEGLHAV